MLSHDRVVIYVTVCVMTLWTFNNYNIFLTIISTTTTFQGTSDTPLPTHPIQSVDLKTTFKNTLLLGERSEN